MADFLRCKDCKHDKGKCVGVSRRASHKHCFEPKVTTNADRLNAMSIEDKAQFLYSIAYSGETPWSKPFYEKFCKDCPAPEYTLDDGRKLCLHECDFKDGKCPHGTDIVWWLQQPAEEVHHE